jgi:hypothetical protein
LRLLTRCVLQVPVPAKVLLVLAAEAEGTLANG